TGKRTVGKALAPELFGCGIDGLQSSWSAIRVIRFNLRMHHVRLPIEIAYFTEDGVFSAGLQVVFQPGSTLETDQLDPAGTVRQKSRQAFFKLTTFFSGGAQLPTELHPFLPGLNSTNPSYPPAVEVPIREVPQQIIEGFDLQFLI